MPNQHHHIETDAHIARIVLDKPRKGNYVDDAMTGELFEAAEAINADNDIYVVILTGTGKYFCQGGVDKITRSPAEAIAGIDRPVIAAVNGPAVGPGFELALAADIRLCADTATFSLPQIAEGRLPSGGATQRLPRIIGRGKALEILLTAAALTAEQALEAGLVSAVYPAAELDKAAVKLATDIAAKGPLALRYLKEAVIKGMDMTLEQGLRLEADLYFLLHTTADRTEGITAFREKRNPEYRGQ